MQSPAFASPVQQSFLVVCKRLLSVQQRLLRGAREARRVVQSLKAVLAPVRVAYGCSQCPAGS
jgi:hypothetical protein